MIHKSLRTTGIALGFAGAFAIGLSTAWAFPASKISGSSSPVIQVTKKQGESDVEYRLRCFVSTNKDKGFGYYKC
jgi:hypothetical protein